MASINEKINYINETKSLIKDRLNDLGSEINNETTFREYAEKIEDLYEEWPKVNDENTSIDLNNTKKGKIKIQLKGNSNISTIGKNKFHSNNASVSWATCKIETIDNILKVTIGDQYGGISAQRVGAWQYFDFDANKKYIFSIRPVNESLSFQDGDINLKFLRIYLYILYDDNTFSPSVQLDLNNNNRDQVVSKKITFSNNKIPVAFAWGTYHPGSLMNNQTAQYYLQLEQNDEEIATNYETYINNASPAPNLYQTIKTVTKNNILHFLKGNLLNFNIENVKDVYLNANGTENNYYTTNSGLDETYYLLPDNTNKLTIGFDNISEYNIKILRLFINFYDKYKNNIAQSAVCYDTVIQKNNSFSYTLNNIQSTYKYIRISLHSLQEFKNNAYTSVNIKEKFYNCIGNLRMNIGESLKPYSQYINSAYPINLKNLELCKKDDYEDYFLFKNNKWYTHQQIDKIILNGTENLIENPNGTNSYDYIIEDIYLRDPNIVISLCNYFKSVSYNNRTVTENNICYFDNNQDNYKLTFRNTDFLSVADFKTWLTSHNTIVYFVLKTPIEKEIVDLELLNQLNALKNIMSYDNNFSIIQNNDNLPFIINASALMKNSD